MLNVNYKVSEEEEGRPPRRQDTHVRETATVFNKALHFYSMVRRKRRNRKRRQKQTTPLLVLCWW